MVAKKRGMNTQSLGCEYEGIKIAKPAEVTHAINKKDLLPPPSARRPTPNGPSKTVAADPANAELLTGEGDVFAEEELLTFLVPMRKGDDRSAEWKFPPSRFLGSCSRT